MTTQNNPLEPVDEKTPYPFFINQKRLDALNKEEIERIKSKTTENAIDILASDCFEKIIKILNVKPGEIFGIDISSIMPPGIKIVMCGHLKDDSKFYDCNSITMAFYRTSKGDDSILHKSYFIDDKMDKLSYLLTIYLKLSKSEMSADCIKSSLRKYTVRDTIKCTLYYGKAPIYTINNDSCYGGTMSVNVDSDNNKLIVCVDKFDSNSEHDKQPKICCISIERLYGATGMTYEFIEVADVFDKLKNTSHLIDINICDYANYTKNKSSRNKINTTSCNEKMLNSLGLSLKFKNDIGNPPDSFDDVLEAVK